MKKCATNNGIRILGVAALVLASVSPALARVVRFDRVQAQETDIWRVWATSGSTRVVVEGDGDTDLDCYVYDRSGNLLGMDDDLTDYCIVDIYQPTNGNLRIEIKNRGRVWNEYRLTVD